MGFVGSSVATSILALVSLGISQMKLRRPSPAYSGMSCHGEMGAPPVENFIRISRSSPSVATEYVESVDAARSATTRDAAVSRAAASGARKPAACVPSRAGGGWGCSPSAADPIRRCAEGTGAWPWH